MPQPRRLFVHIGLQKTGTTFLQAMMLDNAEELARQGLDLVPPTKRDAFELMLLVRQRYQAERDSPRTRLAFDRFSDQLRSAPGPRALLSQESLAAARPGQVGRFLDACADREVHVVLTVRDLARQVPSAWQQDLKAGRTVGYPQFLGRVQAMERRGAGGHPWIHLDPPAVLRRWAEVVPADHVHVVTVPPPGSPPALLLDRFCRVLEVDAGRLRRDSTARNTSLGRVQAEVLRRVNAELPDEVLRRQVYGDVGKRFLASTVLSRQKGDRIRLPAELRGWCEEATARQVAELRAGGYLLEGSYDDLACRDSAFAEEVPPPRQREVAASAVTALARVLVLRAEDRRTGGIRASRRRPTIRRRARRALAGLLRSVRRS